MIINYTTKELDLMARLMRAEALAEGNLGMLMVGNVIVNRALASCYTFKNIRSINDVIYQNKNSQNLRVIFLWQGWRESNSHQKFWRLLCYHYTTPLWTSLIIP